MAEFVKVANVGEILPGRIKVFEVGHKRIALCNIGGKYYAIDDLCTHDGGPLGEGELFGDEIECPRHGARFSVVTGEVRALPAVYPVVTYPLRVEGNEIKVAVPSLEEEIQQLRGGR